MDKGMTHDRWNQIQEGDWLLINKRWRQVICVTNFNGMAKDNMIRFVKINKYLSHNPYTIYCYADLYKKIKAIIKIKQQHEKFIIRKHS